MTAHVLDWARAYVFGSRARGDARPDSDHDVLVPLAPWLPIAAGELWGDFSHRLLAALPADPARDARRALGVAHGDVDLFVEYKPEAFVLATGWDEGHGCFMGWLTRRPPALPLAAWRAGVRLHLPVYVRAAELIAGARYSDLRRLRVPAGYPAIDYTRDAQYGRGRRAAAFHRALEEAAADAAFAGPFPLPRSRGAAPEECPRCGTPGGAAADHCCNGW